jgi:uncharacterized protein
MLNKLFASLVLATSLVACADRSPQVIAVPANGVEVEHPGAMAVTGTATLDVSPDCADLTMTLSSDGAKPGQATASVQAKEKALVAALTELGVAPADLKLSNLQLEPIYENATNLAWNTVVHAYRADITITVTTHDFGKIAPLMDAGAEAGATQMSSAFRRSDLAELKAKVRDMAIAAARDKAEQTAKALGIHLGRITAVSEAPAGVMWGNAYFPQVANMEMRNAGASMPVIGGTLQPLTLDVSISYELPKPSQT